MQFSWCRNIQWLCRQYIHQLCRTHQGPLRQEVVLGWKAHSWAVNAALEIRLGLGRIDTMGFSTLTWGSHFPGRWLFRIWCPIHLVRRSLQKSTTGWWGKPGLSPPAWLSGYPPYSLNDKGGRRIYSTPFSGIYVCMGGGLCLLPKNRWYGAKMPLNTVTEIVFIEYSVDWPPQCL